MTGERFRTRFEVPYAALDVIDKIVDAEEQMLIEALDKESFTAFEAMQAMQQATGEEWDSDKIDALLKNAYRRGVVLLADESFQSFKTGTFYGRLDVFAITTPKEYLALPQKTQKALDAWYFEAYLSRLAPQAAAPTEDRVVTLSEAIEYIDTIEKDIWLNNCDCRTLAGECDKPTDTCISFRSGINTMSHRGWSKPLTKQEAKDVVKRANREGLMQTVNPNGICNCCSDCCYLFRAQQARQSNPAWPAATGIARFDSSRCIGCGLCQTRCPFGAFEIGSKGIEFSQELCRGCGLCEKTCPTGAIEIVRREVL